MSDRPERNSRWWSIVMGRWRVLRETFGPDEGLRRAIMEMGPGSVLCDGPIGEAKCRVLDDEDWEFCLKAAGAVDGVNGRNVFSLAYMQGLACHAPPPGRRP